MTLERGCAVTDNHATVHPRKSPCASCPFRRSVASGVWDESEYSKLTGYDGDIGDQTATAVFLCHQPDEDAAVCAGWLGHRDPADLLAVRLGLVSGHLDVDAIEYSTTVPLFESGKAAAEHGMRDYRAPGASAVSTIEKIVRKSQLRDNAGE